MRRFRRILWTKNVNREEGVLAYGGRDPSVKAREPRRAGDRFELHSTPEDAESLADPEVGDLVVLTQHGHATHLAEVVGAAVEPRSRRTMRKGTRDSRFPFQRTCRLIAMHDFDEAPLAAEAFGFEPRNEGGEVWRIDALPAFEASRQPLWAVQRRLEQALDGMPKVRDLFEARARGPSRQEAVTRELEEAFLGRPSPFGRGRIRLRSSHRGLGPRR